MLAGVVEEIAEDPLEPSGVRVDDDSLIGQLEHGVAQSRGGDVADQAAEVDRLETDLLARGVEP